jgi:hypothetical protein
MRVNRISFSPTTIGSATGHTDCDPLAVLFMENTLALSSLNVLRQAFQSISEKTLQCISNALPVVQHLAIHGFSECLRAFFLQRVH